MNHSFCVGPERRNPDVDRVPTASTITQFPEGHPVFFPLAASFLCSEPEVFGAGSPSKIVPTPYICTRRGNYPISFFHFQALDIRLSSFVDSE